MRACSGTPTASTHSYKSYCIRVCNCEVLPAQRQSWCLLLFSLIKPLQRLADNELFFLWKKSLKLYLHYRLYTSVLEMRRILSLPTDFLQHQELSQSSQVWFHAFAKMWFGCCVHFPAQLRLLGQTWLRVNVREVEASESTSSTVVFRICLAKRKRCWPTLFSLEQSSWESKICWALEPIPSSVYCFHFNVKLKILCFDRSPKARMKVLGTWH